MELHENIAKRWSNTIITVLSNHTYLEEHGDGSLVFCISLNQPAVSAQAKQLRIVMPNGTNHTMDIVSPTMIVVLPHYNQFVEFAAIELYDGDHQRIYEHLPNPPSQ